MSKKTKSICSLYFILAWLALALGGCNLASNASEAPTIAVLSPPQGIEFGVGETVEVTYHAEDAQGVTRVEMTLNGSVVAVQDAPTPQGQTPLEGILRWTPETAGTFNLILAAYNANNERSAPAGVSIFVSGESAQAEPDTVEAPPPAAECAPSETADPNTFTIPDGMHLNSYIEPGGEIDGTFEIELTFTVLDERDGFLLVSWDVPDSGTYQTWVLKEDVRACLSPLLEAETAAQPTPTESTESQPMPTEEVRLETTLHLPIFQLFDFDRGTKLTPAGGYKDFWVSISDSGQPQLEPDLLTVGITPLLAVWGTTEPTYADCSATALAADPIPLTADALSGLYVCIQTGEGLFGYLRLDALRPDPEVGDDALDAVYALWDSGGNERIVPYELHTFRVANVASESGKDLDFWENSQQTV